MTVVPFVSVGGGAHAATDVPTQWTPPPPAAEFQPYDAMGELTDEMVRLANASDLFTEARRSGDGTVQAMTVDGVAVSIALVVTQL